ncbi:MAG: hypothetical protein FJ109_01280 [Deltaproteobacteria bacterium]|nr:hypothetical protein [Deltaproteobacteria bacterium]
MPGIARRTRTAGHRTLPAVLLSALLLSVGCTAAIGDDCSSDAQCPAGSYCDKTMPDGLCTIADCRPGKCPDESVCIEFDNGQSFCMAACNADGDCRDGWSCIKEIGLWPFCSVRK